MGHYVPCAAASLLLSIEPLEAPVLMLSNAALCKAATVRANSSSHTHLLEHSFLLPQRLSFPFEMLLLVLLNILLSVLILQRLDLVTEEQLPRR